MKAKRQSNTFSWDFNNKRFNRSRQIRFKCNKNKSMTFHLGIDFN